MKAKSPRVNKPPGALLRRSTGLMAYLCRPQAKKQPHRWQQNGTGAVEIRERECHVRGALHCDSGRFSAELGTIHQILRAGEISCDCCSWQVGLLLHSLALGKHWFFFSSELNQENKAIQTESGEVTDDASLGRNRTWEEHGGRPRDFWVCYTRGTGFLLFALFQRKLQGDGYWLTEEEAYY